MKDIKAIIWDFDGVFYGIDDLPDEEFYRLCDRSCAEAMQNILPDLSFDAAEEMAKKSYAEHGNSIDGFVPLAKESGIDVDEFKLLFHQNYHKKLFENVIDEYPNLISGSEKVSSKFSRVSRDIKNVILSHADVDSWVNPVLRLRGDEDCFDQDLIWGLDQFDFEAKGKSPRAITMMLEELAMEPSEVLFVEDSLTNLKVAKSAFPDLNTAFVRNAAKPIAEEEIMQVADVAADSQEEVLDIVIDNIANKHKAEFSL